MTPAKLCAWHAHFADWPPKAVMDYLLVSSKASDEKAHEALKAAFPGPAGWLNGN